MDRLFAKFASATARMAGSPYAFIVCVVLVLLWAATGPMFHYSETWQLVINTGTTIITFLMVFLIQNTQNRDGQALQTKLDELIRSSSAEDEYMGIEKLSDKELEALHARCVAAALTYQQTVEKMRNEREKRSRSRAAGAGR
ncbi:MAG TPA: low affinity iron permease family protein [Bordetella sp.]|jgi:low affinity Fe/Cu permease|nr:low affinity iron permease family protein [Bordetella sp.]